MKIADLNKNPDNPRTITDEKKAQLKKALLKFGDLSGIVFNKKSKQLVGGHQRRDALDENSAITITKKYSKPTRTGTVAEGYVELGTDKFTYREVYWDERTERSANIAANKGAGVFDNDKLNEWMKQLSADDDFDMSLTMFDDSELLDFEGIVVKEHTRVSAKTGVDEDEIPDRAPAITKLGDAYILGRHRLLCGDSTNAAQVDRLVKGAKPNLVFTDPPYGVSYEQGKFTGKAPKKKFEAIANDEKRGNDLYLFLRDVWKAALTVVNDTCVFYSWSPPLLPGAEILKSLIDSGIHVQSQIVWDKKRLVLGRADYQWRHEICWYGYRGKHHFWCGDRDQTSVWEQKRDSVYDHPTQKPVELAERAVLNSTEAGGQVLDLFGGSGSTMIACEKTQRRCFTMELDPHYCDVIVARWEKYTGLKAKHIKAEVKRKPATQAKEQGNGKLKSEAAARA